MYGIREQDIIHHGTKGLRVPPTYMKRSNLLGRINIVWEMVACQFRSTYMSRAQQKLMHRFNNSEGMCCAHTF